MRKKIIYFVIIFQSVLHIHAPSILAAAPHELDLCSKDIEKISVKNVGNYRIRISYANERFCQHLEILKRGKSLFHEADMGNHYALENKWLRKSNQLFVTNWSGGMHCCTSLLIFELGKKFRKLTDVYAGNFDPEIIDLNHDGIPEIRITDDFLAYRFSSFATSAKGELVLKYSNGEYMLAEEMMKRAPPSEHFIKKQIPKWRKEFFEHGPDWPPESFIQTLTDLIFTGNGAQASKFIDQAWPKELSGKEDFVKSYKEALSESYHYSKAVSFL